ncbi:MFS transporter [Yinghuangia seranimata]|uniref:MFS transporter n=1 Tax=Yinghuangia seranimata TaxID=408067 RepID=UPI00248CFB92|nr:MFS transporter [Yinghuangia seranimata]MDI2129738.1 MFS transporter [Yinghuangia seranimata]
MEQPTPPRSRAVLPVTCACVLLVMIMVAAINLAIPKLAASDLHPSASQLLWIVDAYVIVFAGLLIPAGAAGDRFGRKGALLTGLGLFSAGATVCALATSVPVLLAGRAVTGAGAALVMPATLSILIHSTAPERRPQAITTWTLATGLGGLLGNGLGAPILEYLPWQGLFAVLAPVGAVLLLLSAVLLPKVPRNPASLDPVGSALLIAGFLAVLYGIIEGPDQGWSSARVLGGFGVGLLLLAAFVGYALRAKQPLLDPRLFLRPGLRAGVLGILVAFVGLFSLFYVNAQYLQYAKGFSVLTTGFAILPLGVGMVVGSRASAKLVVRFGNRPVIVGGMLLITLGLFTLSFLTKDTPYPLYLVCVTCNSLGFGLVGPAMSTAVFAALPADRAGLGSGLNGAAREFGSALGVAIYGTLLSTSFDANLPDALGHARTIGEAVGRAPSLGPGGHAAVLDAFTDAMSTAFRGVALVMLAATALVALWSRERPDPAAASDAPAKAYAGASGRS